MLPGYRFAFIVTDLFLLGRKVPTEGDQGQRASEDPRERGLHKIRLPESHRDGQWLIVYRTKVAPRLQALADVALDHGALHCTANPMEIKKAIRIYLRGEDASHWHEALPTALFQVRRQRNAATGSSPSKLKERRTEEAREHQREYIEKRRLESVGTPYVYEQGDLVLVQTLDAPGRPFQHKWSGPHTIRRRVGDSQMYRVDMDGSTHTHHTERTRPAPPPRATF